MSSLFNSASKLFALQPSKPASPVETVIDTPSPIAPERDLRQVLIAASAPIEASNDLIPQNVIDAIGRNNETLRNRCGEIVRRIEDVTTLNRDIAQIFGQVSLILSDLERTKAELSQRTTLLQAERDAHHELRTQARETLVNHDKLKEDFTLLKVDHDRMVESVSELEARNGSIQTDFLEKARLLSELQRHSHGDREKIIALLHETQTLQAEMARADKLIDGLQADLSTERDQAILEEEDRKALENSISEARMNNVRLARTLEEVEMASETNRRRIADLEAALNDERAEHSKVRRLWLQEAEGRKTDIATLEIKVEAQASRIEATDRLLATARTQHYAKIEELRKEERKAQDAQGLLSSWEQKQSKLEEENGSMRAHIDELEKVRQELDNRLEGLTRAIKAKENASVQLENKLHMQMERHASEMQRHEANRERLEQRVAKLSEQLEKEKLDRSLAQGALEAARKERRTIMTNNVLKLPHSNTDPLELSASYPYERDHGHDDEQNVVDITGKIVG